MVGAIALLAALPLVAADAAEPTDPDTAELQYQLGADFAGSFSAECTASALHFPRGDAGTLGFESAGGSWNRERLEFTYRRIASPVGNLVRITSLNITNETLPVSAGSGSLAWKPVGRVDAYPGDWPQTRETSVFRVQLEGDRAAWGKTFEDERTLLTYREEQGIPIRQNLGVKGPNRVLTVGNGTLETRADLTLYLEAAQVSIPGAAPLAVPQREGGQEEREIAPGVFEGKTWENYAFLWLRDFHASTAAGGVKVFCRGLHGVLTGTWNAYWAKGQLNWSGTKFEFDRRELRVEGAFELTESPGEGGVDAFARGRFTSTSLDFVPLEPQPSPWKALAQVGLWSALFTAIAAILYSVGRAGLGLFSRLSESALIGHPHRRLVLETVRAAPNVSLHDVVRQTGITKSLVRYHARVLERGGLLRSHKVVGDRCFVAADSIRVHGRSLLQPTSELILERDPLLKRLLGILPAGGSRLNPLLIRLAREAGVSRPGAWKAVRRAERHGFISTMRVGREVWVRCAPQPS